MSCTIAALLMLCASAGAAPPAANPEPGSKRVLVIYSDERLLPANVVADDAIRKTFAADTTNRIEFHSEFLDVARFSAEGHEQRQADYLFDKYADRPPDLIIAGGKPALVFLIKHRSSLFAQVPVVFLGLTQQQIPAPITDKRIVGIPATPEFGSTVDLALQLQPQTNEIVVVTGSDPNDVGIAGAARAELARFETQVRFRWLQGKTLEELKQELSSLPKHTIVLYLSMFEDRLGNDFLPREALEQFAAASNAPIYGVYSTYVGVGIVGGSIITFETMGREAARIGIRILAGMEPQAAVGGERHKPTPTFDWRQLQRAGISESQLPVGSVVLFKQYSLWEQYGWHITGAILFGVAQMVLIVALVIQLRRRRRAEVSRLESEERTKRAASDVLESENRFALIADCAPVLIWISDLSKRFTFVNRSWLDFTGRTVEEELGDAWTERVHRDDVAATVQTYVDSFDARRPFSTDFRLQRHDGEYRWISNQGAPHYDGARNFLGYIGSCADITERRQALIEVEQIKERLDKENSYLRQEVKVLHEHREIVGQSAALQEVLAAVEQVAKTDSSVLLLGETGTGKELIARAIHSQSSRREHAMTCVNCAAIPTTLIESELFGREKGAYTGALTKQLGRFEAAHRSTLFLDEVGELPPEVQVKLLRVLQEKQIERLGNPKPIPVDVRIIAATNRDLEQAVREGRFRQDLYYRLTVFPIKIPPLRERRQDIPLLVMSFVEHFSKSMGKQIDGISKPDLALLQQYDWPGNIRELRNTVERAMILASGSKLRIQPPRQDTVATTSETLTLQDMERKHILNVLEMTSWRVQGDGGAADLLGMKRTTLESRMNKLGITRPK